MRGKSVPLPRLLASVLAMCCILSGAAFAEELQWEQSPQSAGISYSNTLELVDGIAPATYFFKSEDERYYTDAACTQPLVLTPSDVMYIGTGEELRWFARYINSGGPSRTEDGPLVWRLAGSTENMNFFNIGSDKTIPVIGTSEHRFSGVFDGDGKTVSLSAININDADGVLGFFGYLRGAVVRGITLEVSSFSLETNYVGAIAAYIEDGSLIEDCISRVSIASYTFKSSYVGGVVGYAIDSTVRNCVGGGSISAKATALGGVVGYAENGIIENCVNHNFVTNSSKNASNGGVVGKCKNSTIRGCGNTGAVDNALYSGGIAGSFIASSGEEEKGFFQCYNQGAISGSSCAGGIVGIIDTSNTAYISNCLNSGAISTGPTGENEIPAVNRAGNGGIVGCVSKENARISYCYHTGSVGESALSVTIGALERSATGGISGWGGTVIGCYSAALSQNSKGHPLVPEVSGSEYADCYYEKHQGGEEFAGPGITALWGGRFLRGEPLTDTESSFGENSDIWQFAPGAYPQLICMAEVEAAQTAVIPRTGGYADVRDYTYTGQPAVCGATADAAVRCWTFGGYSLTAVSFETDKGEGWVSTGEGEGAQAEGGAPAGAGRYRVELVFTAEGREEIRQTDEFSILPRTLTAADFQADLLTTEEVYENAAVTKAVRCVTALSLEDNRDYTVTYEGNTAPTAEGSPAKVVITGQNNCSGKLEFQFAIYLGEGTMTGEAGYTPADSGVYRLEKSGTWSCGEDGTVYQGGIPVYLSGGQTYRFTKHS